MGYTYLAHRPLNRPGGMSTQTKTNKARQAKKRRRIRKPGDLTDMRRERWRAVLCARDVLLDASEDPTTTLKAVHAITSASTAYAGDEGNGRAYA